MNAMVFAGFGSYNRASHSTDDNQVFGVSFKIAIWPKSFT
jgi:hypothetical protein